MSFDWKRLIDTIAQYIQIPGVDSNLTRAVVAVVLLGIGILAITFIIPLLGIFLAVAVVVVIAIIALRFLKIRP